MSGILHSLRTLFGNDGPPSPSPDVDDPPPITRSHRARRRRRRREEREEENDDDDDVFSAFGDGDDVRMGTQEDDERDVDDGDGDGEEEMNTQPPTTEMRRGEENDDYEEQRRGRDAEEEEGGTTIDASTKQSLAMERQMSTTTADDGHSQEKDARADNSDDCDEEGEERGSSTAAAATTTKTTKGDGPTSMVSPLDEFFSHLTGEEGEGGECGRPIRSLAARRRQLQPPDEDEAMGGSSMREWKRARKLALQKYLMARLIGMENDNDSEEEDGSEGGRGAARDHDDTDMCSFSSDVLDEPFGATQGAGISQEEDDIDDNDVAMCGSSEEDEGEDSQLPPLGTQPQTTIAAAEMLCQFGKGVVELAETGEEEEEEEMLPKTQQEEDDENVVVQSPDARGTGETFGGGIRRKRLFPPEDGKSSSSQQLPRTTKRPRRGNGDAGHHHRLGGPTRGGRSIGSIPHVDDTMCPCSNLEDLDLYSSTLDVSPCRILRVWDVRSTKRMEKVTDEEEPPAAVSSPSFERREDDGPLSTIYKRVFSVEASQLVVTDPDDGKNERTPIPMMSPTVAAAVADISAAAFHDGKARADRATARRKRHAVRKIRVFFYGRYADVASVAYREIADGRHDRRRGKKKGGGGGNDVFLMSLANVPAKCILPHHHLLPLHRASPSNNTARLEQYAMHPFGDEEWGVPSRCCVCIGDGSAVRFDDENDGSKSKLYFDDEMLEIRFARAAPPHPVRGDVPVGQLVADDLEDAVITAESVHGEQHNDGYVIHAGRSELVDCYTKLSRKQRSCSLLAEQPVVFNLEGEGGEMSSDDAYANANSDGVTNQGVARPSRRGGNNEGDASVGNTAASSRTTDSMDQGELTTATAAAGAGGRIARPRSIVPLSNLHPLLLENGMQRLKNPINVYGIVLGFSPPSLTRTQEWMMSIVLIDETLPLSNQALAECRHDNTGDSNVGNGNDPKEMHVPSVTLVLFAKDKSKLPVVKMAGDVICCERVFLQAWRDEPQLCARRSSHVVVARFARSRRDGGGDNRPSLANSLWEWGQRRLSAHPTVSPNARLSIAECAWTDRNAIIDGSGGGGGNGFEASAQGDLTAAVTAIIPVPECFRRRDTPRGYVRLWDGTGPSLSDP